MFEEIMAKIFQIRLKLDSYRSKELSTLQNETQRNLHQGTSKSNCLKTVIKSKSSNQPKGKKATFLSEKTIRMIAYFLSETRHARR